ncbi:potassium voltage-gated channel subfamily C member 2-like [Mya arenaria]|uniref:potassium voltage-gated channel subfamily C member 2-like n=1 Tax=Mya arenaria TaxID=6604 RepID=UPI0022E42284|nr:potassium voltage-gated channel subfamily C member 2-like [Mya arenaria]
MSNNKNRKGNSEIIILDIGGTIFKTQRSVLQRIPCSVLANVTKSEDMEINEDNGDRDDNNKHFYFDLDATSFNHILNAYRDGEIHIAKDICPVKFQKELNFWKIPISMLAPCCWKYFYESADDVESTNIILNKPRPGNTSTNAIEDCGVSQQPTNIPRGNSIWRFLDDPASSAAAKVYCFVYSFIVVISSILLFIVWEPWARVDSYLYEPLVNVSYFKLSDADINQFKTDVITSNKAVLLYLTDPNPWIFGAEVFCLMCISVYGTMIYFVEIKNNTFENVGLAMWWSLITMTTVGYGDFFPTTTLGYIVGAVCAINGIIVIALPVAAIASNFSKFFSRFEDSERHKKDVEAENNRKKNA